MPIKICINHLHLQDNLITLQRPIEIQKSMKTPKDVFITLSGANVNKSLIKLLHICSSEQSCTHEKKKVSDCKLYYLKCNDLQWSLQLQQSD